MRTRTRPRTLRRIASIGFAVGFAAAWVVTLFAVVWGPAEAVHPLLVPAAPLLRPIAEPMADWNGLVNMVIAGSVNGAIYAAVVTALTALRRRHTAPA